MSKRTREAVSQTLALLRRSAGQLEAVRRALESSMEAPGGEEWEHQIAAPEEPETEEETEPPKSEPMQARERRLRDLFTLNWSRKSGPRR